MTQKLLSYKDAMEYVGFKSMESFRKVYLENGLPVVTIGNSKKIDLDDLVKFIDEHKRSNSKPDIK